MKISVIIPTLNEQAIIADSIDRAWQAGANEVIVSDGGSDDNTLAIANSAKCTVLSAPKGRASQMNAGSAVATGDVFLFLHADTWLVERGCDQIQYEMTDSDSAWGGFRQRIESIGTVYRCIEYGNLLRSQWLNLVYGDQGLFIKRSLFKSVGGFPDLDLMEDFELSRRLLINSQPVLLQGPIQVSARRWKATGALRQTLRNWKISTAYRLGVSADRLARWYES